MDNLIQDKSYGDRPVVVLPEAVEVVLREIVIIWKFIKYDILSTIVPGSLFLTVALIVNQVPPSKWIGYWFLAFVYFWLYIYTFSLSNQYVGSEEDRINKPSRPIPSGLVTKESTLIRWVVVAGLYLVIASSLGLILWAYAWIIIQVLHNYGRWSWNWFIKNALMGFATFVELGSAWNLVAPLSAPALLWILMFSFLIFVVVPIQDLRDIEGDKAGKRKTMPIVFGEIPTRWYSSIAIGFVPLFIYYIFIHTTTLSTVAYIHWIIMVLFCFTIASRILIYSDKQNDHITYRFLVLWYSVAILLGVWIL